MYIWVFNPGHFVFTPEDLNTTGPLDCTATVEAAKFHLLPFDSTAVPTPARRGLCSVWLCVSVG